MSTSERTMAAARHHSALAESLTKESCHHAALAQYQHALELFRQSYLRGIVSSKGDAAMTLYNMGLLNRKTNQPHQSMACFVEAEELLLQLPLRYNEGLLAETLQQRASLLATGQEAIDCHEHVVSLLLEDEDDPGEAAEWAQLYEARISHDKRAEMLTVSLRALGQLYLSQQNVDEALRAMEECLVMARVRQERLPENDEVSNLVLLLILQLSTLYFQQEDFEGVISLLEEAVVLQKERGEDVALSLNNLGLANERKGDLIKALLYYQELLQLRREGNDPIRSAESMVTCAKILERSRRTHDAMALYHEALAIYQQTPQLYSALIAEIMVRTSSLGVPVYSESLLTMHPDDNDRTIDKAHFFYELARQYQQQKVHQAAEDCLLECRQLLETMSRNEIGDLGIRVDALEQMIQNDQIITAAEEDPRQTYESFHFTPSQADDLLPCKSSESATQFVESPLEQDDDWTLPPLQTRLIMIEQEGVEMEHVERLIPSPTLEHHTDWIFNDVISVTSEIREITGPNDGRLGISQRPTAMEAQYCLLPLSSVVADESDESQITKLAKAVARDDETPGLTCLMTSNIDDEPDPEITLDMMELLEEESDDEESHPLVDFNKSTKEKTDTLHDDRPSVAETESESDVSDEICKEEGEIESIQDSVEESLKEEYIGIQHSISAAAKGVTQIFGFIFDGQESDRSFQILKASPTTVMSGILGHLVIPNPAEPGEWEDTGDGHKEADFDFSSENIPSVNDGDEADTGTFHEDLANASTSYEFSVESSDDYSESSESDSMSHSDSDDYEDAHSVSDFETGFDYDQPVDSFLGSSGVPEGDACWSDDDEASDSFSRADSNTNEQSDDVSGRPSIVPIFGYDQQVDSFLDSSGVPERDVYWNDGDETSDSFSRADSNTNEQCDDESGRTSLVRIDKDQRAPTRTANTVVADDEVCPAKSPSISPTDVLELHGRPLSLENIKCASFGKRFPRNRVVKAISNTFRRVRKRKNKLLPSTPEGDITLISPESSPKQLDFPASTTAVDSMDVTPIGPVQVIKLRERTRSCEDSVSQITFHRDEQRVQSYQVEGDTQWWWGATVNGLEETLFMAHAVADDFFSAQSIHEKRRKKRERKMRELASHHAGSDNLVESDDDSDVFRNLDNEQMHSSDGEEAEDEPAALQERIEKQSHIGPNLEMIALEIDNAKWVPPKNSNSIRGTRGQHKSSKTQNQILEMLNAVDSMNSMHGYYSIEVALALVALGKLQLEVGDSDLATESILQALKVQKAIGNPLEMTRSLHVLAEIYSIQQEFEQALDCYKDAQRLERRLYGPDRPENACTLNRMGRVYANLGNFSLAMEKHQQALQVLKGCCGENLRHPAVSQTLILIGEVYYRERNSFDTNRSNSSDDYGTFIEAGMLDIIALAHEDRGSVKMALCFLEEKIQVMRDRKSPSAPSDMISTLYSLGTLSSKAGLYFEAIDYYEQALGMQRELGCTNVQEATAMVLIGTVDFHMGQYKKSLLLLNDALAILTLALGDDDELVADTLQRIGSVEARLNNFDGAFSHFNRAINIQRDFAGHSDPSKMRMQLEVGIALLGEYKTDRAIEIFDELKIKQENLHGRKHPDIADVLHQLGVAYKLKGDDVKAMALFEEAYQMRQQYFGRDHPFQASTLHEIALLMLRKDQVRKALIMCTSVLEVRKETLGERHVDVALTISTLGRCQTVLGNFGASLKAFTEALPMAEEAVGAKHPLVGDIHIDKAMLHLKKCEFDEAKNAVRAGLAIFNWSHVPETHPRRVAALELLEKVDRDEMLCV